jgi:tripartite-type tricarboxylate transporter receptor subunit TctC
MSRRNGLFREEKQMKRLACLAIAATVVCAAASVPTVYAADTDKYPEKAIRFILPNGAGGSMEKSARRWQPFFEQAIGVPLQFDFIEGSGTLIGNNVAAQSAPDGYTLLMLSGFDFCNTIVNLNAPYTIDSFDVLGINAKDYTAFMVRKDAQWNTLRELLDYMKTQPPETLSMALTNLATSDTLGVTEVENVEGVKFNKVPFNSGSKARTALIGGQADVGHFSLYGSAAILDSVKVLAIHADSHVAKRFADVPTVNSVLGTKVHDIYSDYGVLAPKGFMEKYPERAKKLIAALQSAWTNPKMLEPLKETGEDAIFTSVGPEEAKKQLDELMTLVRENASVLLGE